MTRPRRWLTPANLVALLLFAAAVGGFAWLRTTAPPDLFTADGFAAFVTHLGWRGPLAYVLLVALAVVVSQIPGVPLAMAAGALWGPLPAAAYSVAGGFLGGMIAYFLGRSLGRSAMRALTGRVLHLETDRGDRFLGGVILATRLLPVLSFDLISYAAGMAGVSPGIYALATLLGMIPSTLLLTYAGAAFQLHLGWGLALSALAAVTLVALPWLAQRHNWLGLRGTFRLE